MKAAVYDRYGSASEVLRVVEVEWPEPGPGEVRVKVHVSAVNPTDYKSRGGATPRPIDGFQIPHHDGAGVIDAVGPGVNQGRIGERVWVWLAAAGRRWGTAAEWTVVPGRQAVPLPDGVSFELGDSLGVPAVTAHRCLLADGAVTGQTVLVAGGAGAVGHFAIPRAARARADLAREAGAGHAVIYSEPDAASQIQSISEHVDRVVEVALGANLQLDLAVSRPDTVIVTYAAEQRDPTLPVRACMSANVVLRFVLLYAVPGPAIDQAVTDITAALSAGALTELPSHRFPLDDIVAAHEAAEAGVVGKVLVLPA